MANWRRSSPLNPQPICFGECLRTVDAVAGGLAYSGSWPSAMEKHANCENTGRPMRSRLRREPCRTKEPENGESRWPRMAQARRRGTPAAARVKNPKVSTRFMPVFGAGMAVLQSGRENDRGPEALQLRPTGAEGCS